jgi:hypothetical protein
MKISYHEAGIAFLHIFSIVTKIYIILFILGIIQVKPTKFLELNLIMKILIAAFLIYRFNPYFQENKNFTELDRKISYSAGCFILIISFADVLEYFIDSIRVSVTPYSIPFFQPIISRLRPPFFPE